MHVSFLSFFVALEGRLRQNRDKVRGEGGGGGGITQVTQKIIAALTFCPEWI